MGKKKLLPIPERLQIQHKAHNTFCTTAVVTNSPQLDKMGFPSCVTLTSCKSHQGWGYCMAWNRNPPMPSFLRDKPQPHSQTRDCHGSSLLCSPGHYRHPPDIRNFRKSSCKYLGHRGIMEVEPYERSSFPAGFRNSLNLQIQLHQLKHSLSTVVSVPMDCLTKAPLST